MKKIYLIAIMALLAAMTLSGCAGGGGGTTETTPETKSDTTPPGAPAGLAATAVSSSEIALSWNASTDDVAVAGYKIYKAGAEIGTSVTTAYSDTGLFSSSTYTYTVAAYDAANNLSTQCAPASATTLASGVTDTNPPSTPVNPPAAPAIKLPATGQTACYDSQGTVISCENTGQDGDLKKGGAWPEPRFIANGDAVTDSLTGLVWTRDGNLMLTRDSSFDTDAGNDGKVTWQHALEYTAKLNAENYLGHNDWRLPNRRELKSLIHYGQANTAAWLNSQGFINATADYYWSSTSFVVHAIHAWYVSLNVGYVANDDTKDRDLYVWPVRGGEGASAATAQLPATGQTRCYDTSGVIFGEIPCTNTGQDGELQKGAVWPDPRFTDNGNDTVTDNLTGLAWAKDGNAPGPAACGPGAAKTWQEALDYTACLNASGYLGHTDWRLPDVNELESLIHVGLSDISAWLNAHGFSGVQGGWYWSSTSHASNPRYGWFVHVLDGDVYYYDKTKPFYVWPVRGGM